MLPANVSKNATYCDNLEYNATIRKRAIEAILGPQQTETVHLVIYVALYAILFVGGIVGNVVNGLVLFRHIRTANATSIYLLNLLVSDLLLIILGIPAEIVSFVHHHPWLFGEAFCLLRSVFAESASYATIMTITAFTIERYFAVTKPLRSRFGSRSRAIVSVVLIWVTSFGAGVVMGMQFGVEPFVHEDDESNCFIRDSDLCKLIPAREIDHSFTISFFVFFFVPLVVIVVLHVLIATHVRRSSSAIARMSSGNHVKLTHCTVSQRLDSVDLVSESAEKCALASSDVSLGVTGDQQDMRFGARSVRKTRSANQRETHELASMNCAGGRGTRTRAKSHSSTNLAVSGCTSEATPSAFSTTGLSSATKSIVKKLSLTRPTRMLVEANMRSTNSVNKTLIMVCLCFFVCFAPFMIQRLFSRNIHIDGDQLLESVNEYLFFVAGLLYYSSAIINPIIYNVMSRKFRQALRHELSVLRCKMSLYHSSLDLWPSHSPSVAEPCCPVTPVRSNPCNEFRQRCLTPSTCSSPNRLEPARVRKLAAVPIVVHKDGCYRVRSLTANSTVKVYRTIFATAPTTVRKALSNVSVNV